MGYQFVHLEAYARSAGKGKSGGHNVRSIVAEAEREDEAVPHLHERGWEPKEPGLVWGVSPSEAAEVAEQRASEAVVTTRNGHTRALRKDRPVMVAGVASFPASPSAVETDPELAERYEAWKEATVDWARRKWGDDQLQSVVEHTDEEYAHVHFYVVPRLSNDGNMRIESVHDGKAAAQEQADAGQVKGAQNRAYKQSMRQFQSQYFHEVGAPHGLTRMGPGRRRLTRAEWKAEQEGVEEYSQMLRMKESLGESLDAAEAELHAVEHELESRKGELHAAEERKAEVEAEAEAERARRDKMESEYQSRWSTLQERLTAKKRDGDRAAKRAADAKADAVQASKDAAQTRKAAEGEAEKIRKGAKSEAERIKGEARSEAKDIRGRAEREAQSKTKLADLASRAWARLRGRDIEREKKSAARQAAAHVRKRELAPVQDELSGKEWELQMQEGKVRSLQEEVGNLKERRNDLRRTLERANGRLEESGMEPELTASQKAERERKAEAERQAKAERERKAAEEAEARRQSEERARRQDNQRILDTRKREEPEPDDDETPTP